MTSRKRGLLLGQPELLPDEITHVRAWARQYVERVLELVQAEGVRSIRPDPAATNAAGELRPLVTFPRDAIVERSHVAAAIGVGEETVEKMDLPCFYPSARPRYLWGQVLDELARRSSPDAALTTTHRRRRTS